MAGPSPRYALLLCVALAAACASTPPPKAATKAKRAESSTPRKAAAAKPEQVAPAPVELAPPSRTEEITTEDKPKEVDVVDPGGDRAPRTLVEAARAEKERRAKSGPPVAVITDKNISQHQGQITVAEPKKTAQPVDPAALEMLKTEEYWRNRAVDIRTRLRKAADTVQELELSAAGWRRRFYAEEDPSRRDSKIKPEWDRVLAELEENRQEVETTRQELEEFLDEGRRAGALPGWLREGAEMEPEMEKTDGSPGTIDPSEPQIYEQKPPAWKEGE
ncbi:MAG TPA: hypothetical protein VJ885_05545 [Thermoanaerobaculia bacterium]|nr:hypothetical protein [Thermoanaerobaculia bacterium]